MSETVFKKVDYTLGNLVEYIGLGEIGLPDIQRPFVWKNAKVRDLFDSMYRGYPVGYLLFWQNGLVQGSRVIGAESKQKPPRLLIVDGQQRLTSLYAVVKNVPVVRENYESEFIRVAFNPLQDKFEVTDAAIERDKAYIPDISRLWSEETDLFEVVEQYLFGLEGQRSISGEQKRRVRKAFARLQGLLSFPLTALELSAGINEEDVADVFVRINSKGTPLNQADFILTLMSVFWDEGRAVLERFCRSARRPPTDGPSPFNHFMHPDPDQLLRVSVGLGFKRARLRYVYSILRGKDLETEEFSEARRIEQFEVLKRAQNRALNLQYWHDFMNCVRQGGFRSAKMISSQNNLLFSYTLYLMGRTEYEIDEFRLRRIIARWFFMSSLTGRFTGSPESAMEFDLARFREVTGADGFIATLERACRLALTDDFWSISLPNDLATSSPRSPSLLAYYAALVLLDAKVLFSEQQVSQLLDPTLNPSRSPVERHHLFPKGYLRTLGITETRETNQIANFALVEWADNASISDKPPSAYLPGLKKRFSAATLERMYYWHALPADWETLDYSGFLEQRRELIARVIADGYQKLAEPELGSSPQTGEPAVAAMVATGENTTTEFKCALRTNLHTGRRDDRIVWSWLRTVAGFLNLEGGTLVVGVTDDGIAIGLEADGFSSEEEIVAHVIDVVRTRIGERHLEYVHPRFEDYGGKRVLAIDCWPAEEPAIMEHDGQDRFFRRTGPTTEELGESQAVAYIRQRFGGRPGER
jgi:hypothetical protein